MSPICIITAMPAESRVFIDAFKLRHVQTRGLRIYANEHYWLLQTGLGKLRAAAATAALLQTQNAICGIVNVGIAGSAAEMGSVHLAHQIVDSASGQQWFPHLPPQRQCNNVSTASVHSLDQPSSHYRPGILFDMEASGIFMAASQYLSSDAIHSVKVVSDNSPDSLAKLQATQASEQLQACLPLVVQLADYLKNTQDNSILQHSPDNDCSRITQQIHHSMNDTHQLSRLLQQLRTLSAEQIDIEPLLRLKNAKEVRLSLHEALRNTPLIYGSSVESMHRDDQPASSTPLQTPRAGLK